MKKKYFIIILLFSVFLMANQCSDFYSHRGLAYDSECAGTENEAPYNNSLINDDVVSGNNWFDWAIYMQCTEIFPIRIEQEPIFLSVEEGLCEVKEIDIYSGDYTITLRPELQDLTVDYNDNWRLWPTQNKTPVYGTLNIRYHLPQSRGTFIPYIFIISIEKFVNSLSFEEMQNVGIDLVSGNWNNIINHVSADKICNACIFRYIKTDNSPVDGNIDFKLSKIYSKYITEDYKKDTRFYIIVGATGEWMPPDASDSKTKIWVKYSKIKMCSQDFKYPLAYGCYPQKPKKYTNEFLGTLKVPSPGWLKPYREQSGISSIFCPVYDKNWPIGQASVPSLTYPTKVGVEGKILFNGLVNFDAAERNNMSRSDTRIYPNL